MNTPQQIASHFSGVFFGGNWTDSNLEEQLKDVSWETATTQVGSLNTIAILVFHINYFVETVLKVLKGGPLTGSDKYSFDLPTLTSEKDWEQLVEKTLTNAKSFAALVHEMPESRLWEDFSEGKYGNYYTNLHGIIEHTHYHLGQIALIKKMLSENQATDRLM